MKSNSHLTFLRNQSYNIRNSTVELFNRDTVMDIIKAFDAIDRSIVLEGKYPEQWIYDPEGNWIPSAQETAEALKNLKNTVREWVDARSNRTVVEIEEEMGMKNSGSLRMIIFVHEDLSQLREDISAYTEDFSEWRERWRFDKDNEVWNVELYEIG